MINDGTYEFGDPTVMWLCMPPGSWVTVTKVGWSTKAGLLLLRILNLWWGTQTYVVLDTCETKNSLSVFFTKMRTYFSKETKLPTDQSNICFLDERQCVYRGRRVCWWNLLITVIDILDVSISFLNDHLEETLGLTKNRKKTTQGVSVSHRKVFYPNQR